MTRQSARKNSRTPSARSSGALRFRSNNPVTVQNIVTQKLYDLPADYWDTYPQKVAAITADDIKNIAQKYIDLDHFKSWLWVMRRRPATCWRSMAR